MDEYLERRMSYATVWARRLAIFSGVLLLIVGLGHRLGYLATAELAPVLGAVVVVAVLALLFATRALFLFWHYGGKGGGVLLAAILVALLVLSPFGVTAYRAVTLPMLNDISTDADDPPEFVISASRRTAGMNVIEPFTPERRKLQEDYYPTVTGRRYEAPMVQVVEVVQDLMEDRGWTMVGPTFFSPAATELTIEAQAASPILGLPVDVAVRFIDEDTSVYVDMRSASRYGPHDFGDNADRIVSFLTELDVQIAYLVVIAPVEPAEPPPPPPEEPQEPVALEPVEPLDRSEDPPD